MLQLAAQKGKFFIYFLVAECACEGFKTLYWCQGKVVSNPTLYSVCPRLESGPGDWLHTEVFHGLAQFFQANIATVPKIVITNSFYILSNLVKISFGNI